jgi:hypothetical protein
LQRRNRAPKFIALCGGGMRAGCSVAAAPIHGHAWGEQLCNIRAKVSLGAHEIDERRAGGERT